MKAIKARVVEAIKNVDKPEKSPIIGTTKANTIERLAKIRSKKRIAELGVGSSSSMSQILPSDS